MSGAGKTTLLRELARRGLRTVDTDYDGWTLADGSWDENRISALLEQHSDVVVSGTVDNQVDFYDRFGHLVLLSVPVDVAIARVRARTDNPYGRTTAEQYEIVRNTEEIEPLLREITLSWTVACPCPSWPIVSRRWPGSRDDGYAGTFARFSGPAVTSGPVSGGETDQMVRYASPKKAATATATPVWATKANGELTHSRVLAATAPGR